MISELYSIEQEPFLSLLENELETNIVSDFMQMPDKYKLEFLKCETTEDIEKFAKDRLFRNSLLYGNTVLDDVKSAMYGSRGYIRNQIRSIRQDYENYLNNPKKGEMKDFLFYTVMEKTDKKKLGKLLLDLRFNHSTVKDFIQEILQRGKSEAGFTASELALCFAEHEKEGKELYKQLKTKSMEQNSKQMTDTEKKKELKEFLYHSVLAKISANGIEKLLGEPETGIRYFFRDYLEYSKVGSPFTPEQMSDCYITNFGEYKDFCNKILAAEADRGKREYPPMELRRINVGDLASHRGIDHKFIRGVVTKINENTYTINHLTKGEMEIPKDYTIKFFPGQKYDARELGYNFLMLNMVKLQTKDIDIKEVFRSYNMNNIFLNFSDLDKSNRLKLLKGQETGVITIRTRIENGGTVSNKTERIRLKAVQHEGKINVQIVKGFEHNIYGHELNTGEILRLQNGESIILKDMQRRDGMKYDLIVYFDRAMEKFRVKDINTNDLKEAKIIGIPVSEEELQRLNRGETISVRRTGRMGTELEYGVRYDKPFDKLTVKNLSKPHKTEEHIQKPEGDGIGKYREVREQRIKDYNTKKKMKF